MSYVRQPTDDEHEELKRMTRQAIGRVGQRAQMVLLSAQGRTCPEIARIFETSDLTVRFWLRRFSADGPAGLYDAPRSGRPRKVTPAVIATLDTVIRDDPDRAGHLATFWTVAMLVLTLVTTLEVRLSVSTVRPVLHAMGLRWGRPRPMVLRFR
ncbi:MAG: helix-turn-helix domain-containing protein [Chloroflexota bacterium]|nr:MAG: helix-turn-helix domain-containing protein [Chloroflexota bacterium]